MKQKLNLFILFLILFIGQVNYVKADTTIASGTIDGTSIKWAVTSADGTQNNLKLSFTGSGKIPSYASAVSPWENYNPKTTEVSIASTITEIGDYTFYMAGFSSIKIPSSCTKIGECAFWGCANLKEIYIPSSVVSIGSRAFNNCSSLCFIYYEGRCTDYTGIDFSGITANGVFVEKEGSGTSYAHVPSGWTYFTHNGSPRGYIADGILYVVGKGAYNIAVPDASWSSQRNSIKKIVVKEGVTNICSSAFSYCPNVTEVTLNNTGYIGYASFNDCTALTRLNIGTGLTEFQHLPDTHYEASVVDKSYPFHDCSKLSEVNVADVASFLKITNLEGLTNGYYGTASEKTLMVNGNTHSSSSELVIPEGVTEIPNVAFRYFKNVTKIKLPSTMSTITDDNFAFHTYLTQITLPSSVTSVGNDAFTGCTALTTVTLNNTGTIGESAFKDCTALTRVNIGTGVTGFEDVTSNTYRYPFLGCSKLSIVKIEDLASFLEMENLVYLTSSSYGTAKEKTLMVNGVTHDSSSELVIPEGVTKIPNVAFRYFKNVTKIKFPSTMTDIPSYNFYSHTYLTEVTLNNTGTIGSNAFEGCTALTRVNVGTNLTRFSSSSFSGCPSLSEVNVASVASFLKIGFLEGLTRYAETLMVNGVTHSSLSDLVIPEGVTSIPSDAFRYFKNVTKIWIPSTMTKIANNNFKDHTYLKRILLPYTVTSVGSGAFSGCTNLDRIVCEANTPPATTGSIAENPSEIILKVPTNKTITYKLANIWKEFRINEVRTFNYNVTMRANESKQITNDLLDYLNVKSRTTTNSSIASSTVSSNIVTIKAGNNPTYDGTTTNPYKSAVIRLYLEDDDQLVYNVEVYPREAELTDGNAYKNTKEFEVDKVSYTRSFSEKIIGKWQCFYAPFDIEITDELLEDFDFAKLYMVSYKDENDNGEIEDGEPLKMMLNKLSAGKILHANKPYFVKTKSACTKTFVATNAVLKAAARGSVRCCTTEHEYSLVGIYNPTNIKGFYTMGTSGGFSYYTTDKTINQYRWYMEIKSLTEDGGEYENYARPIEIFVEGEDETTGIIALENKVSDSQNDKIYTLDGRQVTDFETLPSGIYIVNGKKVFKK